MISIMYILTCITFLQIEKDHKKSLRMCPFGQRVGDAKMNLKFHMSVKISAQINLLVAGA
jgi:hypothetical protein